MFKPIKSFISYFQKNSNVGTGIFGPSSVQQTNNDIKMGENKQKSKTDILEIEDFIDVEEEIIGEKIEKKSSRHDRNKNEFLHSNNIKSFSLLDSDVDNDTINVDDLIEDCIGSKKSSITAKTICNPINIDIDKDLIKYSSPISSPTSIAKTCDPFANIISPTKIYVNGDKNFNGIDDDDETAFDEEIFVVPMNGDDEDNENNSYNTEIISDPLALDECNLDEMNSNLTQSDTTSSSIIDTTDTLNNGILCIINVDNIKDIRKDNTTGRTTTMIPTTKETKNTKSNYHNTSLKASATNFDISNVNIEIGHEEQELRSDGSDSGLGLETSTSTNNSVLTSQSSSLINNKVVIPTKSNLKRRSNEEPIFNEKKTKRSIHFDGVSVYYFPRMQGFACIPSQGGCTLGMGSRHVNFRTFSLTDYAAEQRRVHKQQMQEINPKSSSSDETDSDEELSEASGSDLDADGSGFLQPVPARQRRALLKAAGIRKIDPTEKDECRAIRTSREFCGCSCRGYCDPDTCSCSQAGIKCQVDRPSFPCGCTRDGCANVVGRVEFNPGRVRTHFIHTIMRLEIENKQKRRNDEIDSTLSSSPSSLPILNYMSNCITDNSNLPITATMMNTSSNNNSSSLSGICNYNVANNATTNHIGTTRQTYHQIHLQQQHQQHNQNFLSNVHYSNMMHNSTAGSISTSFASDNSHSGCMSMMTNSVSNSHLSTTLDINLMNTNSNHSMDLSYPLRDITTENSICNNLMIDFPNNSNQLFHHDMYSNSNQPYAVNGGSQSFHNQNASSNNSYHLTTAATTPAVTYSTYNQQNYIPYMSQACSSETIEVHDLVSPDEDSNNYISLHPPIANSSRLDAINYLLHNNRNTPPTTPTVQQTSVTGTTIAVTNEIIDPLPIKPATVSAHSESCNLASSAQTSTSVIEGTATKITPPVQITCYGQKQQKLSVVDLTDDLLKNENNLSPIMSTTINKANNSNDDVQIIEPSISSKSITEELEIENSSDTFFREAALNDHSNSNINSQNRKNDDIEIIRISLDLDKIDENTNGVEVKDAIDNELSPTDNKLLSLLLSPQPSSSKENYCNEQEKYDDSNNHQRCRTSQLDKNRKIVENCNLGKNDNRQRQQQVTNEEIYLLNLLDNNNDNNVNSLIVNNDESQIAKSKKSSSPISVTATSSEIRQEQNKIVIENNENISNKFSVPNLNNFTTIDDGENTEAHKSYNTNTNDEVIEMETFKQETTSPYNNVETNLKSIENQQQSSNNITSIANNNNNNSKNINKSSTSSSIENDENLTDIIKKTIFETVTA